MLPFTLAKLTIRSKLAHKYILLHCMNSFGAESQPSRGVDPKYHIVAFGGGSGLTHLLQGLPVTAERSAIVAEGDDDGSSRDLSDLCDIIPVGDTRQAVAAFSTPAVRGLLNDDRFGSLSTPDDVRKRSSMLRVALEVDKGSEGHDGGLADLIIKRTVELAENLPSLKGHPLGNMMIVAASFEFGSVTNGLSSIMTALGNKNASVIPVTEQRHQLVVTEGGKPLYVGQSYIDKQRFDLMTTDLAFTTQLGLTQSDVGMVTPNDFETNPAALAAARRANIAKAGAGSLVTSILSVTNAPELQRAIKQSGAHRVIMPNLIAEENAHPSWTLDNQIRRIAHSIGGIDALVLNKNHKLLTDAGHVALRLSDGQREFYDTANVIIVERDLARLRDTSKMDNDILKNKRSKATHNPVSISGAMDEVSHRLPAAA